MIYLFSKAQAGYRAHHEASYSVGTGGCIPGETDQRVMSNTHLYLVLNLSLHGLYLTFPYAFIQTTFIDQKKNFHLHA